MGTEFTPELFAIVCFLALMQGGEGLGTKAPYYMEEKKKSILEAGWDAMGELDENNSATVWKWAILWGVSLPDNIPKYLKERCEYFQLHCA